MKKLLLTAALLLLPLPASAYPGWTGKQVKEWALKHSFVSPHVKEMHAGVTLNFIVTRKIEGNKELNIYYSGGGAGTTESGMSGISLDTVTIFVQLPGFDNRIEGLWTRNSDKAELLLTNIYDKETAIDFKNSKLVFKGMVYGFESYSSKREKISEVPTQSDQMWEEGEVSFYKGTNYYYEVFAKADTLTIRPLTRLNPEIAIIQHNQKSYAEYKQKEDRKKPVDLNL
ncbi:MAG: hypothetical protein AB7I41_08445 [Candidatus Sericytochromatia bacterium]